MVGNAAYKKDGKPLNMGLRDSYSQNISKKVGTVYLGHNDLYIRVGMTCRFGSELAQRIEIIHFLFTSKFVL